MSASEEPIAGFLAGIKSYAVRKAIYAVRDEQAAWDIVQDAMLKLVEKYGRRPSAEYPMLFQRILQNTIRDFFRRQKSRAPHTATSFFVLTDFTDDTDAIESLESRCDMDDPAYAIDAARRLQAIQEALEKLSARQREAFLLRYWEEMDTAETATIMGCSQGSVKTHCSRAIQALSIYLAGTQSVNLKAHPSLRRRACGPVQ